MTAPARPQSYCARGLHRCTCNCSFDTEILYPSTQAVSADMSTHLPQSSLPCPHCIFSRLLSDVRQIQLALHALRSSTSPATRTTLERTASPVASIRDAKLGIENVYSDLQSPVSEPLIDETDPSLVENARDEVEDMHGHGTSQHCGLTGVILRYSVVAKRFRHACAMHFPDVPASRRRLFTSSPGHLSDVLERIVRVLNEASGDIAAKDITGQNVEGRMQHLDPLIMVVRPGGIDEVAIVEAEQALHEDKMVRAAEDVYFED